MLKNEDSYSGVLDGFKEIERDGRRWCGDVAHPLSFTLHPTSTTNQLTITQSLLYSFQMTKFR